MRSSKLGRACLDAAATASTAVRLITLRIRTVSAGVNQKETKSESRALGRMLIAYLMRTQCTREPQQGGNRIKLHLLCSVADASECGHYLVSHVFRAAQLCSFVIS